MLVLPSQTFPIPERAVSADPFLFMATPSASRLNVLDPPFPAPLKGGLRYALSRRTLGKMERIARAGAEMQTLGERNLQTPWTHTPETEQVLVRSVLASGEIEGETVAPALEGSVPLDLAAVTYAETEAQSPVLQKRLRAIQSITGAALWALSLNDPLTLDFVLELHRRMFETTLSRQAGKIKQKQNFIRGGVYDIQTLPPAKTEAYLSALCERTRRDLEASARYDETSAFLTIAEFLCDFLAIHPFADGNGRCARILSTTLLERAGYLFSRFYPLDTVILETRPDFYRALFEAQEHWYKESEDLTPWISYYTNAVYTQYTRAYQRVRDERP